MKKKQCTLKFNMAQDKSQQKQGANGIIKLMMSHEDEPFLPPPCRIKKVIELEEDVPIATTSITEEHQRQDIKQKQPLKRKTNKRTTNCKQAVSNNISVHIRRSDHRQDIRKSKIPIPTW